MIRRYAPMEPSRGTVIPPEVRAQVIRRDVRCVCDRAWFPTAVVQACSGPPEIDHVRASHGMGMKSETTPSNLVLLSGSCHRWKTANGREARPLLLRYLASKEHTHVEPVPGCRDCYEVFG